MSPNHSPQRFLILTAGFGEGHNSAARHLALALKSRGQIVEVFDPCAVGAPRLNDRLRKLYRTVTTRYPLVWHWFYKHTDRMDFSRRRNPIMHLVARALRKKIDEFRPDAFVSTYPLYPYFIERFFQSGLQRRPSFVVITDSIEINAAWRRAPGDFFLLTDRRTRDILEEEGMEPAKLVVTGFPVHPSFNEIQQQVSPQQEAPPFRILYFPTPLKADLRQTLLALLESDPSVFVTVVLGKSVRALYATAREISKLFPHRVKIKGWTQQVPKLMCSHHLIVGKAGGATVHEAIAAQCPMLVHHLVPGQEAGNTLLLEHLGVGHLADQPELITHYVQHFLANSRQHWKTCKVLLKNHPDRDGSQTSANFIINHLNP